MYKILLSSIFLIAFFGLLNYNNYFTKTNENEPKVLQASDSRIITSKSSSIKSESSVKKSENSSTLSSSSKNHSSSHYSSLSSNSSKQSKSYVPSMKFLGRNIQNNYRFSLSSSFSSRSTTYHDNTIMQDGYTQSGYISGTCADLKKMGLGNFIEGDPNYTLSRDRDKDGVACER